MDDAGSVHLDMQVLCQAAKEPCDQMVRQFQALNERILSSVGSSPNPPEIDIETLGENRFELTLTSEAALEIDAALTLLLPTAQELCKDLNPNFGRYRFTGTEPLAGENAAESSFVFIQELECSTAGRSAEQRTLSPTIDSEAEAEEVTNRVRTMSIEYLTDVANERYEKAYAAIDGRLRAFSTAESWEAEKRSFRAAVGALIEIRISRITIYDNPQDAPEPGLYVAADFDNEYENAPIHCGYLMWFLRDGREFRISREESGHVTAQQLSTIPIEQVPALRQSMRCVAP